MQVVCLHRDHQTLKFLHQCMHIHVHVYLCIECIVFFGFEYMLHYNSIKPTDVVVLPSQTVKSSLGSAITHWILLHLHSMDGTAAYIHSLKASEFYLDGCTSCMLLYRQICSHLYELSPLSFEPYDCL